MAVAWPAILRTPRPGTTTLNCSCQVRLLMRAWSRLARRGTRLRGECTTQGYVAADQSAYSLGSQKLGGTLADVVKPPTAITR